MALHCTRAQLLRKVWVLLPSAGAATYWWESNARGWAAVKIPPPGTMVQYRSGPDLPWQAAVVLEANEQELALKVFDAVAPDRTVYVPFISASWQRVH